MHPKVWLEHGHKIGEIWTINALRLVSESDSTGSIRLGVKVTPIWAFVEVDKYICPVLYKQINLSINVLYNLFYYRNELIEKLTSKKIIARNSLSVIDASIN